MISKRYTSRPIDLTAEIRRAGFRHAELVFQNVDVAGPSYEGRVYFNNTGANENTAQVVENGYAGKFTIFGVGRCWGDEGHCEVPEAKREFDQRSPHQLTPRQVTVNVTEALLRVARTAPKLNITVVPVVLATRSREEAKDCFHFDGLSLRIRSSHGLLEDPTMKNLPINAPSY